MTDLGSTDYDKRVEILSDLYVNYRDAEAFSDLFEYADLAFAIAFMIHHNIIDSTDRVSGFVDETFGLLISTLEIEDTGFSDIDELLVAAEIGGQ